MVLTAYSVISSVTGLSCHRRQVENSTKLGARVGASGPHGFAVRIRCCSSTRCSRAQHCCVHRIPSRVRDDRDTPLLGDETARNIEVFWVKQKTEYFCGHGWTGQITLIGLEKSARPRTAFSLLRTWLPQGSLLF